MNPPEELFDFPCDYQFKVFTDTSDRKDFYRTALSAVNGITPVDSDCIQTKLSSKGNYVCVTLTIQVFNRKQIESIYAVLRGLKDVRYML